MEEIDQQGMQEIYHISEIYQDINDKENNCYNLRYENISNRFKFFYGHLPKFFIRVPSLVQLFGGNLNECGSGHFSFCGTQDVLVAFSSNSQEIIINNTLQSLYPTQKFRINESKFQDNKDYYNLLLIGIKSALGGAPGGGAHGLAHQEDETIIGANMLIDINFPQNRGLGYSNALSTAVCLSLLQLSNSIISNPNLSQKKMIQNLQKYKNVVQPDFKPDYKVDCLVYSQTPQMIYFNEGVLSPLPYQRLTFIIADSLTNESTILTKGKRKNLRNCEERIGVRMILHTLLGNGDLTQGQVHQVRNMHGIQEKMGYNIDQMFLLLEDSIENRLYSRDEIEEVFGTDLCKLLKDIPYVEKVLGNNKEFKPYKRARHILNQANIVLRMREVLQKFGEGAQQNVKGGQLQPPQVQEVADFMNEDYESFKNNLECASPQMVKLGEIMIQSGCLGVKSLGSSWDGSLIGLCYLKEAETIIDQIMAEYYSKNSMVSDDLSQYIFKTYPTRGASLLDPQYEIWFD